MGSGRQGLLRRIERIGRERYRTVFVVFLLLAGLGIFLGTQLELESDVLALIPEGNPQIDRFRDAAERFGAIDQLVVLVDAKSDEAAEDLGLFADTFAERLAENAELIERVDHRIELEQGLLELVYTNALLFLPPEKLAEAAAVLEDEAIADRVSQLKLSLTGPAGPMVGRALAELDPLGLSELVLEDLRPPDSPFALDLGDGYYRSKDGRALILLVKPTGASVDLDFDRRLLEAVDAIELATREELGPPFDAEGLRVAYTGNYASANDESKLVAREVRFNGIASLVAVLALQWICYRRKSALFYGAVPLLIGQAMTFAVAWAVLGGLNASSAGFIALLMGLGTDFVIVIYARYVEERRAGATLVEATERMIGETGLGVFTGAITSAGTFFAACISQFRGLRDLGLLIGSGILLCAVAVLFLLPAMIRWNEERAGRRPGPPKKLHLQSFGVEYAMILAGRYRGATIALLVVLTAIAGWSATQVQFDDTVDVLRSPQSKAFQVQLEMRERFSASVGYLMAVVDAPTASEAIEKTRALEERLQPFLDDGTIRTHESIARYLPSIERQQQVIAAVATDPSFDAERVERSFRESLQAQGLSAAPFERFLGNLERLLAPSRPLDVDALRNRGLDLLLRRLLVVDDERASAVTYLFTADPRWKREPPTGLVEALTAGDPAVGVTGTAVVNREFRRIFAREAPRALLLGSLTVFILLWIDFRSLRLTAIAVAQLGVGVIWMLGLMPPLGIRLNYVNAFVATMILGVGIDYGIHMIHRMHADGGKIDEGLLTTGRAVVIAALTNVAGFGVLMAGGYPALQSFGTVAVIGSLTCLITSLVLVPAFMARKDP